MDDRVRQLPRGRHGLAREEVVASQRGRLALAVLEAVAAHGYPGTTVAHIVKGARVSRETFYEHFASKDDCFVAAVGDGVDALVAASVPELERDGDPLDRVDGFLRAYLDWLSANPAMARCMLLELRGAGRPHLPADGAAPDVLARRIADACQADDAFSCEVLVAALVQLATRWVDEGRVRQLPELHEPLMQVVRRFTWSDRIPQPA